MTVLSNYNVAVVGCGRMGSALITGAVSAGALAAEQVFCIDISATAAELLARSIGAKVGAPPEKSKTLWLLATKPQYAATALQEMAVSAGDLVVSVAAGVRIAALKAAVPQAVGVVRTMPNTPALIGEGITGVLADDGARPIVNTLFGAVGAVVHLDKESHFDALTAVSGSGPAFVFTAIEALADGGIAMGLPSSLANELAVQTVLGAAALAKHEKESVAELRDRVASPGGTTVAGLAALELGGFRNALMSAVRAATERSRELGE